MPAATAAGAARLAARAAPAHRRQRSPRMSDGAIPDICLVLEGTYPFVAGGVSSWMHQLVTQLHELRFCVLHISPHAGFYRRHAYVLPDNVTLVQETFLQRGERVRQLGAAEPRAARFVRAFCEFARRMGD